MDRTGERHLHWWAVAGIGAVPVAVALARFATRGTVLDGDEAVFAMQAADAATGGFPTTGLYSWNGWNHPGPIAFYLFAPFHWISGGAVWGTLLGAGVWSAATMFLVGWLASRRGGPGLVAGAVAVQLATWIAIGEAGTIDPWTPNLAVSLVVPFLLAAWGLAEGDRRAGVVAIVIGLLTPQIHVGYLALFGGVGAVAAVLALWGRPRHWRAWAIGAGLAVIGWLPVIADLLTSRTGNLRALARYFRSAEPAPAGIGEGVRIIAGEASPWPTWITGPRPQGLFLEARTATPLWWLAVVIALIAVAWRTRRRGVIVALAGVLSATLAASQLRGSHFHYLVYWRAPILLMAGLVALAALAPGRDADTLASGSTPGDAPTPGRTAGVSPPGAESSRVSGSRWTVNRASTAAAVLGTLALGAATWSAARADEVTRYGRVLADVLPAARAAAPPGGRVLLRLGDGGVVGMLPGVLHDLEQRGVDIGVDADLEWVVGDRGMPPGEANEVWYITDNSWSFALLAAQPGARVIAERNTLDPARVAEIDRLVVELSEQLLAGGHRGELRSLDSPLVDFAIGRIPDVDPALSRRLAELNAGRAPGDRLGIIAFPPDRLPAIPWPLTAL